MVVREIAWKNFKSYGNTETKIEFDPEIGELILLVGKNGGGKTSIMDAFDFACYGSTRGKGGKRISVAKLPNRLNGDLWVGMKALSRGHEINIQRKLNPSKVQLKENGVVYQKANKVQSKIDTYLPYDFDGAKSFITISINDFKNFMSLTPDEKRRLVDKLFDMEAINRLAKIVKELRSGNDTDIAKATGEISGLERSINDLQASIDSIKSAVDTDKSKDLEAIQSKKNALKDSYDKLSEQIAKAKETKTRLEEKKSDFAASLNAVRADILLNTTKLAAYDAGVCPTCNVELSGTEHRETHHNTSKLLDALRESEKALMNDARETNTSLEKLTDGLYKANNKISEIRAQANALKRQYEDIKNDSNSSTNSKALNEMLESVLRLGEKKTDVEAGKNLLSDKKESYNRVLDLFGEGGIKRSILANIIKPMNAYISDNLSLLELPFEVVLDENFDAKIYHLGEEIDSETLSNGETMKVNMSIMLAYVELSRLNGGANIMFLDEVFTFIDAEGIYTLLTMLRKFVDKYKIHAFLVHHSELVESGFDRVIKVKKSVYSTLEERTVGQL